MGGRVVHFEIHAADPDRAERFYRRVFGWEIRRWDGAPVDYRLVTTGGDDQPGINGAIVERRGRLDGKAVTAFVCTVEVDDLAAVEASVPEAGGEQVVDRQELENVGSFAYFKDTEGNIFGAMQTAQRAG
jgi:predicted enzyme related to lactoylglutathione lyase